MSTTLREIRKQKALSLEQLAKLSGIGKSTLGNYETGRTKISPAKLKVLADCLKTTSENLLPSTHDIETIVNSSNGNRLRMVSPMTALPSDKLKSLFEACVSAEQWDWVAAVAEELSRRKSNDQDFGKKE